MKTLFLSILLTAAVSASAQTNAPATTNATTGALTGWVYMSNGVACHPPVKAIQPWVPEISHWHDGRTAVIFPPQWQGVFALLVPFIIGAFKKYGGKWAAKVPKQLLPVLAPIIANILDQLSAWTMGTTPNPVVATAAGAGAVWLREVWDQNKPEALKETDAVKYDPTLTPEQNVQRAMEASKATPVKPVDPAAALVNTLKPK
jgi:hypothetical protein